MIFLVLFAIIAIIVIALNMYDSSNLDMIKNHFEEKNCQNIIYSKGTYKGLCGDEVMQIKNSFSVDLEKNKTTFKLSKIEQLEKKELSIIINRNYNIVFKDEKNREIFYKNLKEKLNKWKK